MRLTSSSRAAILSLTLAAFASPLGTAALAQSSHHAITHPVASVSSVSSASSWAGVFRLQLTTKNGQIVLMRLIVERVGRELSGTIVSEDNSVAHVNLSLDGDAMKASAKTSGGDGTLLLRETESGVSGSFKVGKTVYAVSGSRSV